MYLSNLSILVVEDEAPHAEAIRRALIAAGVEHARIRVVGTLRAYHEAVAAAPPHIALVDLNLPDGRAVDLLQCQAEDAPFPILVMTSYGSEGTAVEALKSGALDYVVKSPDAFAAMPQTVTRAMREWYLLLERKQTIEALRRSETGFRLLFKNMLEGYASCSIVYEDGVPRDFFHHDVNDAFETMTGLKCVIGKTASEVTPGVHEIHPELLQTFSRVAETGESERFEFWHALLGNWFSMAAYGTNKGHFVLILDNITERKRAASERDATVELLDICNKAVSKLQLLQDLTDYFRKLSGCRAVGVRLQEGDDFPYYVTKGFPDDFVLAENSLCDVDLPAGSMSGAGDEPLLACMCGNILSGRFDPSLPFFTQYGSFWTNSTSQLLAATSESERQARTRNRCNAEGYESVALVPFRSNDRPLGLFQFNDKEPGRFTAEKVSLFERLVSYVAIALKKLDVDEALRESSQFNQQIIRSVEEGIVVFGPDLRCKLWNPFMECLSGIEAGQVLGKEPRLLFPGLQSLGLPRDLRLVMAGAHSVSADFQLARATGGAAWISATYSPLRNSRNEIIGVIGSLRDITAKNAVETELLRSRESLRLAQQAGRVGTFDWELRRDHMDWSEEMARLHGFAPGEFDGSFATWQRRLHAADLANVLEVFNSGVEERCDCEVEFRVVWPDGSLHWLRSKGKVICDNLGQPLRMVGVTLDITAQKNYEEKLLTYQEQLSSLAAELSLTEERERRRIAAELHDQVGQLLAFAMMKVKALTHSALDAEDVKIIGEVAEAIRESIAGIRSLTFQISPPVLYEIGLEAALKWLSSWFKEKYDLNVAVQGDKGGHRLDEETRGALFQLVRELLFNVAKHSRAKEATVQVEVSEGDLHIIVTDDGVGFAVSEKLQHQGTSHTFGLFNLQQRIHFLGGVASIDSEPGRGTRVLLQVPLQSP